MDPAISTQIYLESLGFYTTRANEYQIFVNDFIRLTGSETTPLTLEQFKVDCYARNFNAKQAAVFFAVVDRDHGESIDRYEYALYRAAITNYYPARDDYNIVAYIRLMMVFRMYDFDNSNTLTFDELKVMVKDMVKGENLVLAILSNMGIGAGTSVDLAMFTSPAVMDAFTKFNLHSGELLAPNKDVAMAPQSEQMVVVDPRVVRVGTGIEVPLAPTEEGKQAFSRHYMMNPAILSTTDWRGLLTNRQCPAFEYAKVIIENARDMAVATAELTADLEDNAWLGGNECMYQLTGQSDPAVSAQYMRALAIECARIVSAQDTVVKLEAPVKIIGDIHGQLKDVLSLFNLCGFPSETHGGDIECVRYVFTGNYVDYGSHQVETLLLLMALKVAFPGQVYLLRGSHEFRSQNLLSTSQGSHGFDSSCIKTFGQTVGGQVFDSVHDVFQWLPLAAVVNKTLMVVHSGIGEGNWTLEQLKNDVARPIPEVFPISTPAQGVLANMLWSDPMAPAPAGEMQSRTDASDRGPGIYKFNWEVTEQFCKDNGLQMIIRAHELPTEGFEIHHYGRLWTVCSARSKGKAASLMLVCITEEGKLLMKPKVIPKLPAAVV